MPFGLTNAPSTFQSMMNDTFQPLMRRFVIIFFDDILVYSKSEEDHIGYLEQVLNTLRSYKFLVKLSKCTFGKKSINFLGHIIYGQGVESDSSKILAMVDWPIPKNLKQLRGFLGLTSYYIRFIRKYAELAVSMTDLIKKDSFLWNEATTSSFSAVKKSDFSSHSDVP